MIPLLKGTLPGSLAFLLLAWAIGLLLIRHPRTRAWGLRWLWTLGAAYAAFSLPAVSGWLAAPLGAGGQPLANPREARGAQAIVVLDSGTLRYGGPDWSFEQPDGPGALRALEAARVYRLMGAPLVFVSGGDANWRPGGPPEASALCRTLVALGVAPGRIVLDSESENTRAHALNLVRLLHERGIERFVLVTSPSHMRRALLAFGVVGAHPVPSPAGSLVDRQRGWAAFWPSPDALTNTEQAMHEYAGLLYYRLRGWI